ncbi:MAG TPA: hypothetical protein VL485_06285 [Ktedonobacteraceae bacterium]|nr:hypothetical protein [Ktedonobacteraceae bacterium]
MAIRGRYSLFGPIRVPTRPPCPSAEVGIALHADPRAHLHADPRRPTGPLGSYLDAY